MHRVLAAVLFALIAPAALASGIVLEWTHGDVLVNGGPAIEGQPIIAEAVVVTSSTAQARVRFSDGMQVAVGEGSRLRIVDYRYTKAPTDRVVFDLLQGAARVSTGELARANPKQFFFRTPQAQFGVQSPADFAVALVNPAFLTVNAGTVLASNGAGTVVFAAGSTATIATNAALAAPLAASSFPPAASSAMGTLQTAGLAAPSGAAAGAVATGTGTAITVPALAIGAGVAGAAAALGGDDGAAATTHH
jgi:hypothetical protein